MPTAVHQTTASGRSTTTEIVRIVKPVPAGVKLQESKTPAVDGHADEEKSVKSSSNSGRYTSYGWNRFYKWRREEATTKGATRYNADESVTSLEREAHSRRVGVNRRRD